MALVVSSMAEEKPRRSSFRAEKKPWMLRDYLRDDMSSCSSNGFKSFPRKQCCVAVRNIIEKEVNIRNNKSPSSKPPKPMLVRNRSISSALQRASMVIINAVKLLPFSSTGVNNGGGNSSGKRLLPRSFSKRLFKRSFFWKKKPSGESKVMVVEKEECDEIERWISSGVVGTEKYQPLDLSNDTTVTNSTNSNTSSDGKSDSSWSDDVTFTSDCLTSSTENDHGIERREKLVGKNDNGEEEEVSKSVGVTAGDHDSIAPAVTKQNGWCNEEPEKEQFSPMSVLDFPYSDEGSASPFTLRVTRLKGTTERLMKKLGRFEGLAGLEPVSLESLMSSTELENQSPKHSIQSCSTPSYIISSESESEEDEGEGEGESQENEAEKRVQNLLGIMKIRIASKPTYKFELDNLLLEFLRENVMQKTDDTLLKAADDWLNGQYDKLILGWEVKDKRQAYIRDMEEGGRWPRDTNLQKEEVATELGAEIMAEFIEEMVVELCA